MQYNLVETSWGVEEIEALQEVIACNRFTMGERVALFEKNFAEKLIMDLQKARSFAYKIGESKVVIGTSSYEIYAPTTKKLWEEKFPEGISVYSGESEIVFKRNGLPNVNTTIEIEGYETKYNIVISKISGRIKLEKLK